MPASNSRTEAFQPGTTVTAGVASVSLAATNVGRGTLIVCNDHATNIIYLKLGDASAVVGSGPRLNAAGGVLVLEGYRGAVQVISTGAATNVTVTEV